MDTLPRKLVLHIAGLGAVGSNLVNQINHNALLKNNLEVHGWDFDKVEQHNCGNQFYSYGDIGMSKAVALEMRFPWIDTNCTPYESSKCDILVMATDSMASRNLIYSMRESKHCLDTRLADEVIVSLADKNIADNLDYDDEEVVKQSPCQSGFHADKELVLRSVDWLIEQLENIVTHGQPLYGERRLIGGVVMEWHGDNNVTH